MLILELACLSFAHASPITTVFDNLGGANTYDGAIVYAPYYYAVYASFTTLDPEFVLDDVKADLLLVGSPTGMLDIALYSDSANAPGSLLESIGTIDDSSLTATPAIYDFPVSPITLAPGEYWFGITSAGSPTDNSDAAWVMTNDLSGGVGSQYYYESWDHTLSNSKIGLALKMDVSGYDAPEPSTILFGAIGLAMLAAYRRRVAS